jgi:hypothetical protein
MKMTKERVFCTKTGVSITGATLLSIEEAWNLPNRLMAYKNWWWLRSHGYFQYCIAGVCCNGAIDAVGNDVDFDEASIRPTLKIKNLSSSNFGIGGVFSFGGKTSRLSLIISHCACLISESTASAKNGGERIVVIMKSPMRRNSLMIGTSRLKKVRH